MTNLQHPDTPPLKGGYAFLVDANREMAIVNKTAVEMVTQEGEQIDEDGVIDAGTFVYFRCGQALRFNEDIFTVAGWLGLIPTVFEHKSIDHELKKQLEPANKDDYPKPPPTTEILEDEDVQHA